MTILWMYDKHIDPHQGGTERATHSVMSALGGGGRARVGVLVCDQSSGELQDQDGARVDDLYAFLKANEVEFVINQIGYSTWLLEEFLARGGQRWKAEGGQVITCLHFDPLMFPESLAELTRGWRSMSLRRKARRLVRIALLPLSRVRARRQLGRAYAYLIEQSHHFVILSETHRAKLFALSGTSLPERVVVIQNPNSYPDAYPKERLSEKQKLVLVVSRLDEPQKRVSMALLAWKRIMASGEFPEWTLRIVGDGEYAVDYRELVVAGQIPKVEFIGRANPERHYEQASIYLHTARREGWGLTIAEAMQKGVVPVVMNSSMVFRELIQDGVTGILAEDGDIRRFSEEISGLMRSPARREEMAARAIEAAVVNDIGAVARKWTGLLFSEPGEGLPHEG